MSEHNPIDEDQQQDNELPEDDPNFELPSPPNIKRRIFIIVCILLALIMIGVGVSPLRTLVFRPSAGVAPTSTPIPGDNLFYIQEALPGTVTIDGHDVTNILDSNIQPPINAKNNPPLRLSVGVHQVVWQGNPFKSLACTVYVPSFSRTQPCHYESAVALTSGINVWLVSFTPALSNLPVVQQTKLKGAIQATLDTLNTSDTVQTGEQYLRVNATGNAATVIATQPLKAILSLRLDTDPSSNRSCIEGYGDNCNYNGQNCLQICTFAYRQSYWLAVALYYPAWTYTTESGQMVAQNQPDTNSAYVGVDHSVLLQVRWNSSQGWHVIDVSTLSQTSQNLIGVLDTSIPACASFTGLIGGLTKYGSTSGDGHILIQWQYYVGNDPAMGCLGVVLPSDNPKAPPAYFLYRFGVLLAANSLAHSYYPDFPVADAYEQGIAQSIAAQHNR
jgi:hypothetical protein